MGCGGSSITADDIRSDIMIREEDRADLIEMLASKLKKSTFTFNMLYNGRIHGFEAYEFHERCDEKGPTVTICESENGYIFGKLVYPTHFCKCALTYSEQVDLHRSHGQETINITPIRKHFYSQ